MSLYSKCFFHYLIFLSHFLMVFFPSHYSLIERLVTPNIELNCLKSYFHFLLASVLSLSDSCSRFTAHAGLLLYRLF